MPKTPAPVPVNNVGWTTILAQTYCKQVRLRETNQSGTSDFYLAAPTTADGPNTIPAGKEIFLRGPFAPGNVVANIKMVTGSTTFDVTEDEIW